MSAGNSRAAYMRVYRKGKRLEEDICNNVPKRTKLNAGRQRDYRKRKAQEKSNLIPFSTLILFFSKYVYFPIRRHFTSDPSIVYGEADRVAH
jgi:hypothetical protein